MPHCCHCVVTAGRAGCFGGTREVTLAHHISVLKSSFLFRDLNGPELRHLSGYPFGRYPEQLVPSSFQKQSNGETFSIPRFPCNSVRELLV